MTYKAGGDYACELSKDWNEQTPFMRWSGFALGVIILILGGLCFVKPDFVDMGFAKLIAWIVIIYGAYRLAGYFSMPVVVRSSSKLIAGIFAAALGYLALTSQDKDIVDVFTALAVIDLVLVGIDKAVCAAKLRYLDIHNIGWLIADGVINLLGAFLILVAVNVSNLNLVVFVGIFVIICGASVMLECINSHEPGHCKKVCKK